MNDNTDSSARSSANASVDLEASPAEQARAFREVDQIMRSRGRAPITTAAEVAKLFAPIKRR